MIIIFDLWNTLARKNVSFSTALRKHFSLDFSADNYKRFEQSTMLREWESMEEMAIAFLQEFNLETSKRNISFIVKAEEQMLVLSAPISGMRRLLEKLQIGNTVAVLSNATCFANQLLHKWGLSEHIDRAMFSWQLRLLKPNHQVFTVACDEFGVSPSDCLFVDDNAENCHSAKKVGMDVILFENPGQLEQELRERKLLS